jgi:hypothetical protein
MVGEVAIGARRGKEKGSAGILGVPAAAAHDEGGRRWGLGPKSPTLL